MGLGIQLFNPKLRNIEPIPQLGVCVPDSGCGTVRLFLYLIFLGIRSGWRCHGIWNQHRGIFPIISRQRSLHGLYLIPVNDSRLVFFCLGSGSYIRNLISDSRLLGFRTVTVKSGYPVSSALILGNIILIFLFAADILIIVIILVWPELGLGQAEPVPILDLIRIQSILINLKITEIAVGLDHMGFFLEPNVIPAFHLRRGPICLVLIIAIHGFR